MDQHKPVIRLMQQEGKEKTGDLIPICNMTFIYGHKIRNKNQ